MLVATFFLALLAFLISAGNAGRIRIMEIQVIHLAQYLTKDMRSVRKDLGNLVAKKKAVNNFEKQKEHDTGMH